MKESGDFSQTEQESGWVYFVQSGNRIKIGWSEYPSRRLSDIRTSSPNEVTFLGVILGGRDAESEIQRRFSGQRVKGEWYLAKPPLTTFIHANAGPMPSGVSLGKSRRQIRWNKTTMDTILAARNKLEELGMRRPSIRAVLYLLMGLPDWSKKHYTTLCRKLGEWRDSGQIPFGILADDGAGGHLRPLTMPEIRERIKRLENMVPATLLPDGYIGLVFTEHVGLVDTISGFLGDQVPVVSSQGQLRREHLFSFISEVIEAAEELNARGIRALGLVDWDRSGREIYQTHASWLKKMFKIDMHLWAITSEQLQEARLPVHEDHQLDGVIAAYGPVRFRQELRVAVGLR